MKDQITILQKPILANEIEWKIQSYTKDKTKTIIVPYVTARCVMDRFDAAFSLDWQTEFKEVTDGFICKLSIFNGKEWISREDGANNTKIEPLKGGISDSLKRAAHQFGLGRNLYDYPRVMLKGEIKFIPNETLKRLHDMTTAINNGSFTNKIVII